MRDSEPQAARKQHTRTYLASGPACGLRDRPVAVSPCMTGRSIRLAADVSTSGGASKRAYHPALFRARGLSSAAAKIGATEPADSTRLARRVRDERRGRSGPRTGQVRATRAEQGGMRRMSQGEAVSARRRARSRPPFSRRKLTQSMLADAATALPVPATAARRQSPILLPTRNV